MPRNPDIHKVLVIGSGPIVIGQAAEFDYAGAQACRALREEGLTVVLVNSNPATIMTDSAMADEIYIEPLTLETVKRIIRKEKPDSLLSTLGGQTGLTLSMQLAKEGFLAEHGVRLLGADPDTIDKAEDRQLFKDTMERIGQPVIPSLVVTDLQAALEFAHEIGYPVIVRPAFTLGGSGGGIAGDEDELREIAGNGLRMSPIHQILVEKSVAGWKEIEFEVMRDSAGNVITICSMENFDPVGVHTGDSIVIAPAVTLADREYQMLRTAALDIISALGVEGGCNCQFALEPGSFEYAVIEVNPRVSRSSALASKATGYPIAKVATKIAVGYTLDEIPNAVTGTTSACFEPALDYVVVKLPKWPFDKFVYAKRTLGTQMKATGEVMAIGRTFEEALMKAVRGAECGTDTLRYTKENVYSSPDDLSICDDRRLFRVFAALLEGETVGIIHEKTRIDRFFIDKIKKLADFERCAAGRALNAEEYRAARRMGYTDGALERLSAHPLPEKLTVSYKTVDTCAAEFAADQGPADAEHDGGGNAALRRRDGNLEIRLNGRRAERERCVLILGRHGVQRRFAHRDDGRQNHDGKHQNGREQAGAVFQMEQLHHSRHQHHHADEAVHHAGYARQQLHRRAHDRRDPSAGHLGKEHRRQQAHGHADDDGSQRAPDAGEDERQNAEFRLGGSRLPFGAEQEVEQADLPDGRQAGDDHIYGDERYGGNGRRAADKEHRVHDFFDRFFQRAPAPAFALDAVVQCCFFHIQNPFRIFNES